MSDATDLLVNDTGSFVMLTPLTCSARAWFDEHVQSEPWQWQGDALAVDYRYADAIIDGCWGALVVRGIDVYEGH
jgi:hypothetical protein